jgi:hypothetical protein
MGAPDLTETEATPAAIPLTQLATRAGPGPKSYSAKLASGLSAIQRVVQTVFRREELLYPIGIAALGPRSVSNAGGSSPSTQSR